MGHSNMCDSSCVYNVSSRRYVPFRYFLLLIPLAFFGKEAAHVQGFAKECAVVTHHRLRASVDQGYAADANSRIEPIFYASLQA